MANNPNRIVDPCYRAEDLQPMQKARRRRRRVVKTIGIGPAAALALRT